MIGVCERGYVLAFRFVYTGIGVGHRFNILLFGLRGTDDGVISVFEVGFAS